MSGLSVEGPKTKEKFTLFPSLSCFQMSMIKLHWVLAVPVGQALGSKEGMGCLCLWTEPWQEIFCSNKIFFLASLDPPKKNDLPGISWIFFTFDFFYFGCWEKSAKVWAQTSVFPLLRVSGYPLAPRGQALPGRQVWPAWGHTEGNLRWEPAAHLAGLRSPTFHPRVSPLGSSLLPHG